VVRRGADFLPALPICVRSKRPAHLSHAANARGVEVLVPRIRARRDYRSFRLCGVPANGRSGPCALFRHAHQLGGDSRLRCALANVVGPDGRRLCNRLSGGVRHCHHHLSLLHNRSIRDDSHRRDGRLHLVGHGVGARMLRRPVGHRPSRVLVELAVGPTVVFPARVIDATARSRRPSPASANAYNGRSRMRRSTR